MDSDDGQSEKLPKKEEGPLLSAGSIIETARKTIKSLARSLSRNRDKTSQRAPVPNIPILSTRTSRKTENYQLLNQTLNKAGDK